MTRYILILFVFYLSIPMSSQVQIIGSGRDVNDMVYSSGTNKIYAIVSQTDLDNPKSLCIINPNDNTVESSLSLDNEPKSMAISNDEQYIYIGFSDSSIVKRFSISTQEFDQEFSLGNDSSGNPFSTRDIAIAPGEPTRVAICTYNQNNIQSSIGVTLFENGIQKPNTYEGSVQKIKFKDASTLIGHAGSYIPSPLTIFNVNNNGLSLNSVNEDMPNPHPFGISSDFIIHDNKAYFKNGKVVDIASAPFISGTLSPAAYGASVYDGNSNKLWKVGEYLGNIYLRAYNINTYQSEYDYSLFQASLEMTDLITCGSGCLAFNTSNGGSAFSFIILRNVTLGVKDLNKKVITLSPNPSSNIINIDTDHGDTIKNIDVYGISGNLVAQFQNTNNTFDIQHLAEGMYLVKLTDGNDNTYTQKIVKI